MLRTQRGNNNGYCQDNRICQNSRQISILLQDIGSFHSYSALHIVIDCLFGAKPDRSKLNHLNRNLNHVSVYLNPDVMYTHNLLREFRKFAQEFVRVEENQMAFSTRCRAPPVAHFRGRGFLSCKENLISRS